MTWWLLTQLATRPSFPYHLVNGRKQGFAMEWFRSGLRSSIEGILRVPRPRNEAILMPKTERLTRPSTSTDMPMTPAGSEPRRTRALAWPMVGPGG